MPFFSKMHISEFKRQLCWINWIRITAHSTQSKVYWAIDNVRIDVWLIQKISKCHLLRHIENSFHEVTHRGQNSKQINIAKYISKFLIYGAKILDKCVKSQKKILYIVLFCKVNISKMIFIKTNKIKKQTVLFYSNFSWYTT